MLDDFRQQAQETSFEDEPTEIEKPPRRNPFSSIRLPDGNFLGLTAQQRFIIALLFLLLFVLGGTAGLLLTGKVVPIF